ncbi:hypothetical protein Tco_0386367 [Tanacetum coccineum]
MYQVTLDALKLSPCYPAFLITTEVPEIYMHKFWNTINKIRDTDICLILPDQEFVELPSEEELVSFIQELGYFGKCDMLSVIHTDQMNQPWRTFTAIINRNMINIHTIRDDSLLGTLKFVSKTEDYHKYGALIPDGMINQDIKDSKAYKTYYNFATGKATPKKARKFKKVASPSKKLSLVLEEGPVKKPKKANKPVKKSTTMPTIGVVIRDTPGVSISKKKSPAKVDRGKGMDILSDAALLEAVQVKESLKKSKKDSHMLYASGSGDRVGSQPKVLDESQDKTIGTNEGSDSEDDDSNDDDNNDVSKHDDDDADSDGDSDNDASDSERTDSDEEKNPNLNLKDDKEEETQDDEYVHTPDYYVPIDEETNDENKEFNEEEYDELYKDVNTRSKVVEHEEVGKGDAEMIDAALESVSQEKSYEQVIDDAHVTLIASQKTEGSKQSSSVSSDFASKFLILDNVPPADNEVASMMNVKVRHEESSTQAPHLLLVPMTAILKTFIVPATTVPLTIQPFTPIPQQSTPTPTPTFEPSTTSIPVLPDFHPYSDLIREFLLWKKNFLN